jgi:ComF family protein
MELSYLAVCLFRGRCPSCAGAYRLGICPTCSAAGPLGRKTPGGLQCWALGSYCGALRDQIGRLKYGEETWLAGYLGGSLARVFSAPNARTALVPVPLHPTRLVERGYNQSALLARAVGHHHRLTVEFDVLRRRIATDQQARLNRADRAHNVQNAFIARPAVGVALASTRLWLVDDVITTGQTIDACAQALQLAGYTVEGALCCALSGRP